MSVADNSAWNPSRNHFFPKNYQDSRATFLELTSEQKLGPSTRGEFSVPSKDDPNLYVNWVHVPPSKSSDTLLVLVSGTHGPESYLGAMMQRLFLEELFPKVKRDQWGVLLLHALNPYGFKNHRRVTEKNIDLNRNFGLTSDLYRTPNEKYGEYVDILAPQSPVSGMFFPFLRTVSQIAWQIVSGRASRSELTKIIESGQYRFPKALQYGGSAPEPQTTAFVDVLRKEAAPYARVIYIDFHTGLGEKGALHILPGNEFTRSEGGMIAQYLEQHPDPASFHLTSTDSKGFYPVSGDTADVPPLLFPDKKVLAFVAEFGTLGKSFPVQLDSLQRLIQENQGFHHGYATPELKQKVEARFLELFYPAQDQAWKTAVVDRGRRFLLGLIRKLPGARLN